MNRTPRRAIAAAVFLLFSARTTGAADLAVALSPAARGAMTPMPGRWAPRPGSQDLRPGRATPPPAEPRTPWTERARDLASYLFFGEPALAARVAVPPRQEAPTPTAVAAPTPPPDRMLINMGGLRLLAAGPEIQSYYESRRLGSEMRPLRPRLKGEWLEAGDLRARVDYLNPIGVNRGEAEGFRITFDGKDWFFSRVRDGVPAILRGRETGIYFTGQAVGMETLLENRGETPLTVRLSAAQEALAETGRAGAVLSAPYVTTVTIPPGGRKGVRWSRVLRGGTRVGVASFEQTHLRVSGEDGAVLLDAPQANIVDPPTR